MQIDGIFNLVFCAFVLFRMEVLVPIHTLPLYFKACNKAYIALYCVISTQLGVKKHLEFNSSPEGKSNGI